MNKAGLRTAQGIINFRANQVMSVCCETKIEHREERKVKMKKLDW
jgi:hypothetical protein